MELKEIAARIKYIRKYFSLSQPDFANKLGISKGAVQTYEHGNSSPGYIVLSSIVEQFSINSVWLLTGKGQMFVENAESGKHVGTPLVRESPGTYRTPDGGLQAGTKPVPNCSPEELIVDEALRQLGLQVTDDQRIVLERQVRSEIKIIVWNLKDAIIAFKK